MPTTVPTPRISTHSEYGPHSPINGRWKVGVHTSTNASISARNSPPEPTITSQWNTPTWLHFSIRVRANVSLSMVANRGPNGPLRVPSAWPRRMMLTMLATVRQTSATATTADNTVTMPSTYCTQVIWTNLPVVVPARRLYVW